MEQTLNIGVVGFPGVMALDLVGPVDAFTAASDLLDSKARRYQCFVLSEDGRPFTTASGLRLSPHCRFKDAPSIDTLVIPGGPGLREPKSTARIAEWVKRSAPQCRRVASVCTGIYGLAATGLLDGRRVTTHWRFAGDVAQRFPALRVSADAIYVQDGPFWTSAGVSAGIDLTLAMIEADHGARLSLAVARELVVYLKRDGGQNQFSEPLKFQAANRDRLGALIAWINAHLAADLSVEVLAQRACVSRRHLTRQCRDAFGLSPAELVEVLRLDAARHRLTSTRGSILRVAQSVGFQSDDTFRRAFERRFAIAPHLYRRRFQPHMSRGGGAADMVAA